MSIEQTSGPNNQSCECQTVVSKRRHWNGRAPGVMMCAQHCFQLGGKPLEVDQYWAAHETKRVPLVLMMFTSFKNFVLFLSRNQQKWKAMD